VMGFFKMVNYLPRGWLWTVILLISASWVARITGVSHWAWLLFFFFFLSFFFFETSSPYVVQDSSASTSRMLGLQMCTTTPSFSFSFLFVVWHRHHQHRPAGW
jgi:hypothetical protein